MSLSIVEVESVEVPFEGENAELEENEVPKTQLSNPINTALEKFGFPGIGFFGYVFKGPEKFEGVSNSDFLNKEISNFVDNRYRCAYGEPSISKRPESNSLGNITGLHEMSKIPIKFINPYLEYLYSLNLNEWMVRRFPFIAIIYLVMTIVLWPLVGITFRRTLAWVDFPYVYILFHVLMTLTLISISIPLICIWKKLTRFEEMFCYWSLGIISFIWGLWNILATIDSSSNYSKESFINQITSREALKGLTCIYAMLPIVALDSFLPTRTSKTWLIHLQFIVLYSASTFLFVLVDIYHLPWIYIVLRTVGYTGIILFMYFGSYNSDVQIRISFYNWLTSSRKISRLEKDIHGQKTADKAYAPAELILSNVRTCLKIAHIVRAAVDDRVPEIAEPIDHMCYAMNSCLEQMTTNKGLYSVSPKQIYKDLGNEADIINSYINSYYKPGQNYKTLSIESGFVKYQEPELHSLEHDRRFSNYIRPIPNFENTVELSHLLNDWNFNILEYFDENTNPFVSLGYCLLAEFESHFQIPQNIVLNFLTVVEGLYKDVPYHNCIHGVFVAQKISCLANFIGLYRKMSVLDRAIMVVSAICHDVGHPGKTNSFLVNSGHEVAHLFNDKSVLENFHCCLTFNILKTKECNIFSCLGPDKMKQVRRRIIELILATDMEDHFEFISRFRVRRLSDDFSVENDLLNICKMLIKASDLGSTCIPWDMSLEWIQRLYSEFYSQGELEKKMHLPVSALCDPNRHIDLPRAQSGFLRLVVSPLFEEIAKIPNTSMDDLDETQFIFITDDKPSVIPIPSKNAGLSPTNSALLDLKKSKPRTRKLPKAFRHYEELITGNINTTYTYNTKGCDICSDDFERISEPDYTPSIRVITVCLTQLRENIEEWDRMAELGQTIPYNEPTQDSVSLDIQLAIQT